jgi:hypothetical protein
MVVIIAKGTNVPKVKLNNHLERFKGKKLKPYKGVITKKAPK